METIITETMSLISLHVRYVENEIKSETNKDDILFIFSINSLYKEPFYIVLLSITQLLPPLSQIRTRVCETLTLVYVPQ